MSTHIEPFDESLLHIAHRLVKGGQCEAAIQIVERLVKANPCNLDGWLFLAYHSVGVDNARAAHAWENIARLRPHDHAAQQALISLREILGSSLDAHSAS